jgi:hypothetical protein
MSEEIETMRELYESEGYNPDELTNPKDVTPEDINNDSTVVVYTVVRNPDINGPATTYALKEWDIEDVVPTKEWEEYTDGMQSYPLDTPVTHSVHYAFTNGMPKGVSIGYGEEMYGGDSDFDDPHGWERTTANVRGVSDDFIRFNL